MSVGDAKRTHQCRADFGGCDPAAIGAQTDLGRAIDFACQMAGRNLTEEEWQEFLPAQPYQSVCPDE